ncbi:MAG: hypothetical protein KGZ25_01050 [Planctomycetes bacterium]|nr:hypothetical protein [Planctomycetota bacterium]
MSRRYHWDFPLPRTHTGILQGNGRMGTILWGNENTLRITIGRADLWDHRGGSQWTPEMNYENIRKHLKEDEEESLNDLFRSDSTASGEPDRPTVLPVGRIDLQWDSEVRIGGADLSIYDGLVEIETSPRGRNGIVRILHDMKQPLLLIEFPPQVPLPEIKPVPAWEFVGEELAELQFEPPEMVETEGIEGWIQKCPVDPAICVGWTCSNGILALATGRGNKTDAVDSVSTILSKAGEEGFQHARERSQNWWKSYWDRVPEIDLPNERLQFLYDYGMYKFAGFTNPDGVPATLQGPWIEEYRMPPWSSDYHFNVNVQMCYQPAFHGNLLHHLQPLWEMIAGWEETLRDNARNFLGIDDGLMLPHAVSDDCRFMTGYWGHSADHGCTAWVASMMFRNYRYSQDVEFLRETAFPFMRGTMRVYEEMLERTDDGTFRLPVGISPEYFNKDGRGWGPNASFQLACIHRLCEDLLEACSVLAEDPKPIWQQILDNLPKACLIGDEGEERIALWENQALEESHRHHSHLGAITPFDVIDPHAEKWEPVVQRSLTEWILRGPGKWSGWCLSWASAINTRADNPEAAELWLEVFDRFFTNEGEGTLHNCRPSGISLMGAPAMGGNFNETDVMQMDGGMGSVAAIQEMLLHTRRGVNYLFAGAPSRWDEVQFDGMLTDGAFKVSASRKNGLVGPVRVESLAGGTFRLKNPWKKAAVRRPGATQEILDASVLEIRTEEGEILTLHEAE